MQALSPGTALLARLGVVACALFGLYLGGSRGFSTRSDTSGEQPTEGEHVASAKAIAPPPAPTFDETAIRRIAREEAQTLVAKSQASSAAVVRRRAQAAPAAGYTTPSDAGIVYAKPPRVDSPTAPPAAPTPVPQF